jgi:transcriptional regulator with XRE-family HTH domain
MRQYLYDACQVHTGRRYPKGFTQSTMSYWQNDKREPSIRGLMRLADVLGMDDNERYMLLVSEAKYLGW